MLPIWGFSLPDLHRAGIRDSLLNQKLRCASTRLRFSSNVLGRSRNQRRFVTARGAQAGLAAPDRELCGASTSA